MKYAAIDIGTNSVRLLICDKATDRRTKRLVTTRLGEGLMATGMLCEAALIRTERAVRNFVDLAREDGCILPVFCYATSAAREARNGAVLLERLAGIDGLIAEIIPGEAEAMYGYRGAAMGEDAVVMDIGGGSTELIRGEGGSITASLSIKLGCVTSLENYVHNDPVRPDEAEALRAYAEDRGAMLCRRVLGAYCPHELVGIGGTATQLAMLKLQLDDYDPRVVTGTILTLGELEWMYALLCGMTDATRKTLRGMDPGRSDVIVSGCAIAMGVLKNSGAHHLLVRDADGLDGYFAEKYGF